MWAGGVGVVGGDGEWPDAAECCSWQQGASEWPSSSGFCNPTCLYPL
jgi:hypothetical protein